MDHNRGLIGLLLAILSFVAKVLEGRLFVLVGWYDAYIYSPLQRGLWPFVERISRSVEVQGQEYTVFSANIVSWARTGLVVPIAICLKYEYCWTAFLLVLLHDFLDHLDGIVAKVHRHTLGEVDDPLLGGFMDAFCDKIVNFLALWSIAMVTDFSDFTWSQTLLYLAPIFIIMAYEFTLGVVRVQDYFRSYYYREFKKSDDIPRSPTAASMEGKLKEKLESMGIAFLCLGQSNRLVITSLSGMTGLVCLTLSIRLAHASLASKLKSREGNYKTTCVTEITEKEAEIEEMEEEKETDEQENQENVKI